MTLPRLNVIMTELLGVAETKRRFAELIDRVLRGERVVVTRRGRPVAALVPASADALRADHVPLGLAAFAGALADWDELADVVDEIYASRPKEVGRPVPEIDVD